MTSIEKAKGATPWIEAGYTLFANEGMNGIQVERLARILQRNKSGFYHYFGDMEAFSEALVRRHKKICEQYFAEIINVKSIDPEFLEVVARYKEPILFHIQSMRIKNPLFLNAALEIDQKENEILRGLWADYLGLHRNPDLALRYFNMIRDMFHTRVAYHNLDYQFLHDLVAEAKSLVDQILQGKPDSVEKDPKTFEDNIRKVG